MYIYIHTYVHKVNQSGNLPRSTMDMKMNPWFDLKIFGAKMKHKRFQFYTKMSHEIRWDLGYKKISAFCFGGRSYCS